MHPRIERLLLGSRFAGIEAEMRQDGIVYHGIVLKRAGTKITVEKSFRDLRSPEEIQKHIDSMVPAALVFTGKGIIYRNVQADPQADPHVLLGKVLPNAAAKEFFIAAVPGAGHTHVVAVARKSSIDTGWNSAMISVISAALGPAVVQTVLPFFDSPPEEISCGNHTLTVEDNFISSIQYKEAEGDSQKCTIGGEEISGDLLIAFAAAFHGLIYSGSPGQTAIDLSANGREEFLQRSIFRKSGKAALVAILLILASNYLGFSHYWELKSDLESQLQGRGNAVAEVNALKEQVEAKSEFLLRTGLLDRSSFAWYADQLAHDMPKGIQLTRMNFSPRMKIAVEDSIAFAGGQLEISGRCQESVVLNQWLQQLKTEKWIRSASVQSYIQNRAVSSGEFKLDLVLQ